MSLPPKDDDRDADDLRLSEEERKKRAEQLTKDIADRYDPDKLAKIVVGGAGKGEKLDPITRQKHEKRIGGNFSNVRIFRGPFADAVTKKHGADAVTIARTELILVADKPRSDPRTARGQALLAHELTHVKQAQRGMHFAGETGSAKSELENPAELNEAVAYHEESHDSRIDEKRLAAWRLWYENGAEDTVQAALDKLGPKGIAELQKMLKRYV